MIKNLMNKFKKLIMIQWIRNNKSKNKNNQNIMKINNIRKRRNQQRKINNKHNKNLI